MNRLNFSKRNDSRIEIEPSPQKPETQSFSALDRSLLLGTLPMQPFDSFSGGPNIFRLPLAVDHLLNLIP